MHRRANIERVSKQSGSESIDKNFLTKKLSKILIRMSLSQELIEQGAESQHFVSPLISLFTS